MRILRHIARLASGALGIQRPKERSDYKCTWQQLSSTEDAAKTFVSGTVDEAQFAATGAATVDLLRSFVGIHPTDVFLEIGCGVGRVGRALAPLCQTWIGTDISGNMVAHARRRLRDLPNVQVLELGGAALAEIPSESVDVVYCTVVFMHLYEWDRCRYVYEAYRVLKPGGRIFYDNVDVATSHGKRMFDEALSVEPRHRPPYMSMTSSGDELEAYARWAGFESIRVHRWHDAWVGVSAVKGAPLPSPKDDARRPGGMQPVQ
jgi:SAM-dependent methyltransferase